MPHIRHQKFGFQQQRGGGNQVIRVVDPGVGKTVHARQLAGRAGDVPSHCNPGQRLKESLERS